MGQKNRKKHHGGGHKNDNSSSTNYTPKLSEQELCELVTEATQMHVLLNQRHQKMKQSKDFVYILSTKWLREWKDYVGYDSIFNDQKQSSKKTGKRKPGAPNTDLTSTTNEYIQIPQQLEQYSYLNQIIRQKMQKGDDYIPVTKQIWTQFNNMYGPGTQIKRPCRMTKYNNLYVDSELFKFECIFLNMGDENLINKLESGKVGKNQIQRLLPKQKVQVSKIWNIQQLYAFFQKICLVKHSNNKVTLWMCHNFVGYQAITEQLQKSAKSQTYELYAKKLEIQDYQDLDIDDFLKQQYVIVAEIGDSRIKPAPIPEDIHGYCEQCLEKRTLSYRCLCSMKLYCSEACRIDDQNYHFNVCKLAFSNEDDQQIDKKKVIGNRVGQLSRCGLKNLGNTCYMNSVLQSFLGFGFLVDFLTSNTYTKYISEKEKNASMFLDATSRFCKRMSQQATMGSIEPWDIKGKINHFLNPFKGYKQHDALDFMMAFINTINDCLAKTEQQAYQKVIKDNLVGFYDSLIICPQCENQATNIQPFIQLTLPIKQKVKKTLYNYAIFHNPLSVVHGKAEVLEKWSEVRADLGVSQDCLVYFGGQGEAGLTDVETIEDKSAQNSLKKCKKEVLFYPYQKIKHSQIIFGANFITTKTISGCNMKANSGYPFPVVADTQKTIGHFFISLMRLLNLEKNRQELLQNLQKKYEQIKQKQKQEKAKNKQQKQTEQQAETSNEKTEKKKSGKGGQKKESQADKHIETQIQKQMLELNQLLSSVLEQINMQVYIQDLKKIRNICFFCKRKCQGCLLTPDFRTSVQDSLAFKVGQARISICINPKLEQQKVRNDIASSGDATIKDCLTLFSEPETLDEENAWYCPTCQDMRLAFKQLNICQYPKMLILQLSRFKNGQNGKVKNNEPIVYNEYQNFGLNKFRLSSVIIHEGSIQGGHYWAICRRGNDFFSFNDEKISKTQKICNKNAYILCYQMIEQGEEQHKQMKIEKKIEQKGQNEQIKKMEENEIGSGKEKRKYKKKQNEQ